jgi:hypothetical protein
MWWIDRNATGFDRQRKIKKIASNSHRAKKLTVMKNSTIRATAPICPVAMDRRLP